MPGLHCVQSASNENMIKSYISPLFIMRTGGQWLVKSAWRCWFPLVLSQHISLNQYCLFVFGLLASFVRPSVAVIGPCACISPEVTRLVVLAVDGCRSQNALLPLSLCPHISKHRRGGQKLCVSSFVGVLLSLFISFFWRREELTLPWSLLKLGNHLCSQINTGRASAHPLPFYKQRATQ